ncbi:winged helix-turn-helix domain-containing protein [Cellulosimicrobium terreum]|nr:winged helix-turn-helix domain-containing protein [Cellulosimicrobium terreum]
MTLEIDVLGPLRARVDGREMALGGPGRRALLAALVLGKGRVVTTSAIVDTLWVDDPPASAVTKVQGHVSELRKALAAAGHDDPTAVLVTAAPGYLLRPGATATDLARFEADVVAAQAARRADDLVAAETLLAGALELWRGPALADVSAPTLRAVAGGLDDRRLRVLEDHAEVSLALGRSRDVLDALGPLLVAHPFRDRLNELFMVALIRTDRPSEAIATYRRCREMYGRELGIEPSSRLRRLVASLGYPS